MSSLKVRLDYLLKHNRFVHSLFNLTASTAFKLWGLFIPVDKDMIIFSGLTRRYNDSARAIYERMLSRPEFSHLKMVWALDDPENTEIPGSPIKVKSDTLAYFKMCLKAKYWVACVNIERSLHFKKKSQKYLNTWHGLSFNCIGNDASTRGDFDWRNVDYCCYESDYHKEILKKALRIREEALIPTGLPRNDNLYKTSKDEIIKLKKDLGLSLDKKIIMYAPTWRDSTNMGASYDIKPPININLWKKELGNDYIVLMRTHAYTTKLLGIEFDDFIRNFTSYPNINDLFKVADILISDYSACMADFSILEKPIICFAYDLEEYREARGLYFDPVKDMPNGVQKDEKEVIALIKSMDYDKQCELTRDKIKNRYTYIGGNATDDCIDYLFDLKK